MTALAPVEASATYHVIHESNPGVWFVGAGRRSCSTLAGVGEFYGDFWELTCTRTVEKINP